MSIAPLNVWRRQGDLGRLPYLLAGVVLLAVKYGLDCLVAWALFDRPWSVYNYFVAPSRVLYLPFLPPGDRLFYGTLLVLALPFIYFGVVLTVRRLRDVGLSPGMVVFFFVPLVNLLFFLLLSLIPSRPTAAAPVEVLPDTAVHAPDTGVGGSYREAYARIQESERWRRLRTAHRRVTRGSSLGSATLSVCVSVPAALGFIALSTAVLKNYGWGLFVGTPFCLGLGSVVLFGLARPQNFGACMAVAFLAASVVGLAALVVALEGAICLIMAAPIGFFLVFLGALVGYFIQSRPWSVQDNPAILLLITLTLPGLLAAEAARPPEPPLLEVVTAVEVDAAPERVWRSVISFPDLPEPDEALFRAGVAYPVRAEIQGRGPGAVRHCVFSTGTFVEPIEVWDEPYELTFRVGEQPEPLREWSPYDIHPPHLDHYLVSHRGRFRLVPLPGGRTRLEGTTWYSNRMWPEAYWQLWSDAIIHRIHRRVLVHIKGLAERPT
jgi:hypothetical protein